jgi:hypothetical protein
MDGVFGNNQAEKHHTKSAEIQLGSCVVSTHQFRFSSQKNIASDEQQA